jgi:hypothetical protein
MVLDTVLSMPTSSRSIVLLKSATVFTRLRLRAFKAWLMAAIRPSFLSGSSRSKAISMLNSCSMLCSSLTVQRASQASARGRLQSDTSVHAGMHREHTCLHTNHRWLVICQESETKIDGHETTLFNLKYRLWLWHIHCDTTHHQAAQPQPACVSAEVHPMQRDVWETVMILLCTFG